MTKKNHFAEVDSGEWDSYFSKADEHQKSAATLAKVGNFNSACLLLVHAAIGYSDAVSIFVAGRKSTSDSHASAVRLLADKFTAAKDRDAIKHFDRILGAKSEVEYTDTPFREREWIDMNKHLDRFRAWAISKIPRAGTATA